MNLFQKETVSTNKNCRSGNGTCSTILPAKELDKDGRFGCSTANTVESSNEEAHMPSTSQSVLRISMKNGQPLFTFAAGNNSNILAATVKRSTVLKKMNATVSILFTPLRRLKRRMEAGRITTKKAKVLIMFAMSLPK